MSDLVLVPPCQRLEETPTEHKHTSGLPFTTPALLSGVVALAYAGVEAQDGL